jgi:hypothetical protein
MRFEVKRPGDHRQANWHVRQPGSDPPQQHRRENMSLHYIDALPAEESREPKNFARHPEDSSQTREAETESKVGNTFRIKLVDQFAVISGYDRADITVILIAQLAQLLEHPGGAFCGGHHVTNLWPAPGFWL